MYVYVHGDNKEWKYRRYSKILFLNTSQYSMQKWQYICNKKDEI